MTLSVILDPRSIMESVTSVVLESPNAQESFSVLKPPNVLKSPIETPTVLESSSILQSPAVLTSPTFPSGESLLSGLGDINGDTSSSMEICLLASLSLVISGYFLIFWILLGVPPFCHWSIIWPSLDSSSWLKLIKFWSSVLFRKESIAVLLVNTFLQFVTPGLLLVPLLLLEDLDADP